MCLFIFGRVTFKFHRDQTFSFNSIHKDAHTVIKEKSTRQYVFIMTFFLSFLFALFCYKSFVDITNQTFIVVMLV